MSYLIDKYLKRLSEEYHNSKEVLVFCHLVLKEGHFNATHFMRNYKWAILPLNLLIGAVSWEVTKYIRIIELEI